MALKQFTIDFKEFGKEKSFRYDVDFIAFQHNFLVGNFYSFNKLFSFSKENKVEIEELEDDFYYSEIGNVSKDGDVEPVKLNFNERREEEENYYKKIEKGDIIKAKENEILLSKVRPNLKKYVLINSYNNDCYYTSAFVHLIPKKINKILYYAFRSIFYENLIAISRQGKGYPTLKEDDFLYLKFDKNIIDNLSEQEHRIISRVEPIEHKIKELEKQIKPAVEVINDVFTRKFGFDLEKADKNKKEMIHLSSLVDVANEELKFDISLKYRFIFKNYVKNPSKNEWIELAKIIDVKGGKRLPKGQNITEENTGFKYIRVDDLNWSGIFNLENIKYISGENHKRIKNYIAKENDILLTIVGATVGKCGLLPNELDGENITENFARIIIKDRNHYLPEYINYCLQSKTSVYQIDEYKGRGSQGKLALFRIKKIKIPNIDKYQQQKIVDGIKAELDRQEEIKQKIETERSKIDEVIKMAVA